MKPSFRAGQDHIQCPQVCTTPAAAGSRTRPARARAAAGGAAAVVRAGGVAAAARVGLLRCLGDRSRRPTRLVWPMATQRDSYLSRPRSTRRSRGEHYLGALIVRHQLTPEPAVVGGHVGYHVVAAWQRQVHATRMLGAKPEECRRWPSPVQISANTIHLCRSGNLRTFIQELINFSCATSASYPRLMISPGSMPNPG